MTSERRLSSTKDSTVGDTEDCDIGGTLEVVNRPAMTVADVYDMAADIGKEFEFLIDAHGPETVAGLMQKVIAALEHLEAFAAHSDAEETTVDKLKTTIVHLELEETKKNEERQRNAMELEQIEEHYKQETRDLLNTVKRLQDANRKLSSSLAAAAEQRDSAFSEDESYFEVDLVNRLQSVIDKQRGQIKKSDQNVLDLKTENEELKCSNEKLNCCTRDLRRKYRQTQNALHEIVDERAELTAKLNDAGREIQTLSSKLGEATKHCVDLEDKRHQEEIVAAAVVTSSTPTVGVVESIKGDKTADGKPKFTLPELKDILQERNALKARVSDLEDELSIYRPRKKSTNEIDSINSPRHGYKVRMTSAGALTSCDCSYHSKKGENTTGVSTTGEGSIESDSEPVSIAKEAGSDLDESVSNEEDLPVQGPLPQDPEDAPWKKQNESGIRKLFRRVFGSQVPESTARISSSKSTPNFKCQNGINQLEDNSNCSSPYDEDSYKAKLDLKKSRSRLSFFPQSSSEVEKKKSEEEKDSSSSTSTPTSSPVYHLHKGAAKP